MAKILVVGSRKDFNSEQFQAGCRAIGRALAKRGHTIVASGCGVEDAETWVLEGANESLETRAKVSLIPFTPAEPNCLDLIETADAASKWPKISVEAAFRTKGPWAVGQAVALIRSDAALLIGGGLLTANVGALGLELEKPYYAVSALDGAARKVAEEDYSKHLEIMKKSKHLISPSLSDGDFGKNVVAAVELLIAHRRESAGLRKNLFILLISLAILGTFLCFLFRHDLLGNEARLVYTTCLGALVGAVLAFLISHVVDRKNNQRCRIVGADFLGSFSWCALRNVHPGGRWFL